MAHLDAVVEERVGAGAAAVVGAVAGPQVPGQRRRPRVGCTVRVHLRKQPGPRGRGGEGGGGLASTLLATKTAGHADREKGGTGQSEGTAKTLGRLQAGSKEDPGVRPECTTPPPFPVGTDQAAG